MKEQFLRIYRPLRDFLFSIVNREFLIFLFFLVVSGVFWLLSTLNDTDEYEYAIPISLKGVPRDVIITTSFEESRFAEKQGFFEKRGDFEERGFFEKRGRRNDN